MRSAIYYIGLYIGIFLSTINGKEISYMNERDFVKGDLGTHISKQLIDSAMQILDVVKNPAQHHQVPQSTTNQFLHGLLNTFNRLLNKVIAEVEEISDSLLDDFIYLTEVFDDIEHEYKGNDNAVISSVKKIKKKLKKLIAKQQLRSQYQPYIIQ